MIEREYVSCVLKLKLRPAQERMLTRWLWHLTGVYNWASRKIELDAKDRRYWSAYDLEALVRGHGLRIGIPTHTVQAAVRQAHRAWKRCFDKSAMRPRLKGRRNRLNSISFPDPLSPPTGQRIALRVIGRVQFHKQDIPNGPIKNARLLLRASGWHLVLVIAARPAAIEVTANSEIGIDPGFVSLLTLSTGEKIEHPHELKRAAERLGQAERGHRKRLAARLSERVANQRRDRNHKLSRRLVSENSLIAWSKDSHSAIARRFGKSVASAAHGDLRIKLSCKSRQCGRQFVEVSNRNSTRLCSACGGLSGPTGLAGLKERTWTCMDCGTVHDRDRNAAINTLAFARGIRVELGREVQSGIAI